MMQPVLHMCDRDNLGAYLETAKSENLPFYERHGFKVTGTIGVGQDPITVWLMWRNP